MDVQHVGKKSSIGSLSDWDIRYNIIPRMVAPTHDGVRFICDTGIGYKLGRSMAKDFTFGVWECTDKARWAGDPLGYVIIPGGIGACANWMKLPSFKTWNAPPNAAALMALLSEKLPEIFVTQQKLREEASNEKANKKSDVLAAD